MEERKVVSIEDRIPKLKQTRRKKANRRLILYLTILFLLIATVIYLQSPLSNVRHIVVDGEYHVSEEEIQELAGVTTSTNYWRVDEEEMKQQIESHQEITFASIDRSFPNTVRIEVNEAERIGYIKKDGSFHAILEDGSRLEGQTALPGGDAPILVGFTKETYLKEISQELKELPSSVSSLISEIHWDPRDGNPYQILLYMNDGFQVQASIRSFSEKMPAYPSIVSQLDEEAEGIIHIDVGAYFEEIPESEEAGEEPAEGESEESTEEPVEGEGAVEGEEEGTTDEET
ncbi:cell division protein FtsQ/DivIB [Halobacillus karajensis]|uniref:Cell division protein DivIB n=1 Tax=Halobacillus karajensis TaxID=195088 RepID=A0A024P1Y2_9BACI|nr:cell division protein FtsQ/DivIB [Halobacillus karajensis]CDQ19839.1 Cell division protein DivIB [Halobacillus karajensis]CDQ22299.1 Cell division protein DivIB [Halobacillus karajensis]CDQ28140.1 Cell division protein DivIB [Halobacillus karajensis]